MDCLYTFTQNPITFYSCGNLVSPGGFLHQRRTLHCHVLIYVLEGTLSITANGHAREVAPGEYIFLRSEEEHFGHAASSGKLSYLWMHFDTHTPWSRISSEEGIRIYDSCTYLFPEYGRGSTDFPLLSGDLMQWYRKGTAVAEKALPQTASLLLFHLTSAFLDRRESRPLTLTPVIVAVKEYIRTNCHTALTTSEIAAKYGYNCAYLSSLFKKETGISMTECIHRERISLAQMLLSNPAISIKEAAFSSGFTDEKYFMKLFRRYTGMTPSAYRALTPYG